MIFFGNSMAAAEFVGDLVGRLKPGSQLTMTIKPDTSVGFCVSFATDMPSEDTGEILSKLSTITLTKTTPDG